MTSRSRECLASLVFAALLCGPTGTAIARDPNIVVILVDDMGYGDPGCFNPAVEDPDAAYRLAGARRHAVHRCARSGAAVPHVAVRTVDRRIPVSHRRNALADRAADQAGQMTIASLAKSQGYRTAMVGKWHVGFREDGYDKPLPGGPLDCGFDSYFGMRASTDIPPYFYIRGDRAVQPPTDHIEDEFSADWSPHPGAAAAGRRHRAEPETGGGAAAIHRRSGPGHRGPQHRAASPQNSR